MAAFVGVVASRLTLAILSSLPTDSTHLGLYIASMIIAGGELLTCCVGGRRRID